MEQGGLHLVTRLGILDPISFSRKTILLYCFITLPNRVWSNIVIEHESVFCFDFSKYLKNSSN